MRAPASAGSALLVGTGPGAGQVRFVELAGSQARYVVRGDDGTARGSAPVDGSAWHVWTVEWTAESAVGLVDGREWFRADARALLPRGPLHLCLQAIRPEGARQGVATLEVDHVRDFAPRTR